MERQCFEISLVNVIKQTCQPGGRGARKYQKSVNVVRERPQSILNVTTTMALVLSLDYLSKLYNRQLDIIFKHPTEINL